MESGAFFFMTADKKSLSFKEQVQQDSVALSHKHRPT